MQGGNDARVDVEDLVKRAKEGHEASFAALYGHFFDRIFRYVSFKMGNSAEAEDITGEVFLKMLESIHSFKWQGYPFSSWLFRIAHNLVVDHFRKSGKKKTVPLDNMAPSAGAYSSDMDGYVDLKLTMREVQKAMEGLTSLQQEVISLRFAADLSVSETARAVGKKENAVKALQHAGLKKLQNVPPYQRQRVRTIVGQSDLWYRVFIEALEDGGPQKRRHFFIVVPPGNNIVTPGTPSGR